MNQSGGGGLAAQRLPRRSSWVEDLGQKDESGKRIHTKAPGSAERDPLRSFLPWKTMVWGSLLGRLLYFDISD